MRSASWGACFYLITTDILGPYGVGFALGTLGWGPGIALYTVFGFMAGYSGYLIWVCSQPLRRRLLSMLPDGSERLTNLRHHSTHFLDSTATSSLAATMETWLSV